MGSNPTPSAVKVYTLKLHEYQAKALLSKYGISVPRGREATTPQEAREIAQDLGGPCVVKAQVHAGGRGKAGGVRLVNTPAEAEQATAVMLGTRLITHQTALTGAPINQVLVEETLDVERELYLGIVIDGEAQAPIVIASRAGGMDIEEISTEHPDLILREAADPIIGFQAFQARRLVAGMGLPATVTGILSRQMICLYEAFVTNDCSIAEINPMVITEDERVIALDAKLILDDDALFRHQDILALRDWDQDEPLEAKAGKAGIAYVKLEGNVGCMVNGAGLAMGTMDTIKASGSQPANFLDVGGGASPDRVAQAMSIILADPMVDSILVNIFGGIARCDDIARGIIQATPEWRKDLPIIVRFLGTNMEDGNNILRNSGLNTHFVSELAEATQILNDLAKL